SQAASHAQRFAEEIIKPRRFWYNHGMSFAHKIRVAVIRGGSSSTYDASLKTGETVLRHLPAHKYDSIDVFIDRDGIWHVQGIAKNPADALGHADVAFVALHGGLSEEGRVQRI